MDFRIWGGQNLGNLTRKHIKTKCFQELLYMSIQHTVILYVNVNAQNGCFFVVKRYTVREAKKWRYAVRNAKIKRYAIRKGGGVSPSYRINM